MTKTVWMDANNSDFYKENKPRMKIVRKMRKIFTYPPSQPIKMTYFSKVIPTWIP